MNLKQLTNRLKSPRAAYWADVSQEEIEEMNKNIKNSWSSRHERHFLQLSIFIGFIVALQFYMRFVHDDWTHNAMMAILGTLIALSYVVVSVVFFMGVWGLCKSVVGDHRLCSNSLKSLEFDAFTCAEALRLSENVNANAYRLAVLKKGRQLYKVDVAIMKNLFDASQLRQVETMHKEMYTQLHTKTSV